MSLHRLIYYSTIGGGWAAFLGWMVFEVLLMGRVPSWLAAALCGALVGAGVGAGLGIVGGMASAAWKQLVLRAVPGLLGGFLGGLLGAGCGEILYSLIGLPRAFGWMVMGLGIGAVEGLYERSRSKFRNGLIGGGIGGLLGGLLFNVIFQMLGSATGMTSRAVAFVLLGMFIGFGIGLVQVVLKEAWLTVLDGYRPGRQLILSKAVSTLGAGEWATLPFLGSLGKQLDMEHVRLSRQPDGAFVLEDNNTRLGTAVNGQRVQGTARLRDGDVIKLGPNLVRFSERVARTDPAAAAPVVQPVSAPRAAVLPVAPVVAPPLAAQGPPRQPTADGCPRCGRKAPGKPGQRYCIIDDVTF